MKINEGIPRNALYLQKNNQKPCNSFDACLQNPSNRMSGDEYYWQHLDQLQKSCLVFNKPLQPNKANINPSDNNEQDTLAEAKAGESTTTNPVHLHPIDEQEKNQNVLVKAPTPTIKDPKVVFNNEMSRHSATVEPFLKHQANDRIMLKELKEKNTSLEYKTNKVKTHHVFIDNGQAELSLSVHDLPPTEIKQLSQLCKDNLKRKNISLKQFIINGVKHD